MRRSRGEGKGRQRGQDFALQLSFSPSFAIVALFARSSAKLSRQAKMRRKRKVSVEFSAVFLLWLQSSVSEEKNKMSVGKCEEKSLFRPTSRKLTTMRAALRCASITSDG